MVAPVTDWEAAAKNLGMSLCALASSAIDHDSHGSEYVRSSYLKSVCERLQRGDCPQVVMDYYTHAMAQKPNQVLST